MAKSKSNPNLSENAFKSIMGITTEEAAADNQEQPPSNIIEGEQPIITPKEKEETRSKRVNLVIKPSVYAAAQRKCKKLNISMNECINQFLETWGKE